MFDKGEVWLLIGAVALIFSLLGYAVGSRYHMTAISPICHQRLAPEQLQKPSKRDGDGEQHL